MKSESLREVKNSLSRVIEGLRRTGPVLITKNGKTRAVLLPVGPDTDLESLLLSQNPRLWELIDNSVARGRKKGLTRLEDRSRSVGSIWLRSNPQSSPRSSRWDLLKRVSLYDTAIT